VTLRLSPAQLAELPSVRLILVGRGRSRRGPTTIHAFLRVVR